MSLRLTWIRLLGGPSGSCPMQLKNASSGDLLSASCTAPGRRHPRLLPSRGGYQLHVVGHPAALQILALLLEHPAWMST
jgi:hypothetical protein